MTTYIKTVYLKILNEYFQNASYYKPTGDGLIIIIPFNSSNLRERANSTVESCLNLLESFSSLCAEEPMVYFPTPNEIGIGIARGSACCIINLEEDKVLDYSGRVLNLASRLMDMARPSGIVIDAGFRITLLDDDYQDFFANEKVYVRGIATSKPITVYYTKKGTSIPKEYKNPPIESKWETVVRKITYGNLKKMMGWWVVPLDSKPVDYNRVFMRLSFDHPDVEENEIAYYFYSDKNELRIRHLGDTVDASLEVEEILSCCTEYVLTDDAELRFKVTYPIT